jgi:DNA modification methylase
MEKILVTNFPINKIIPYKKNPRKNAKAIVKVAESLTAHGYIKISVGVDENDVLLYGHTTIKAMEKLGWESVPEVSKISGLTDAQKISYRIADNKTSEYAQWDFDLLYENMKLLESAHGFSGNFDSLGMTKAELASLRKAHEGTKPVEIPEIVETDIKVGDLILLGKHRLVCGDCRNVDAVTKCYNGEIASVVFTSPPYNVGKEGWLGSSESKYEGNDDDSDVREYSDFLFNSISAHLSRCVYLFLNIQMVKGNKIALCGLFDVFSKNLADIIIWDKQTAQPAMSENILNSQFEFIICLKDAPANRKIGTQKFRGTVSNVYSGPPNRENEHAKIHSASFPLHLPTFIIKNFTNPKEIVSDPFIGLGTTLIACEQLDRVCYGMEINPIYCEIACQTWEKFTGKKREVMVGSSLKTE